MQGKGVCGEANSAWAGVVGWRMVSPVCTTRNVGGFIPERVGGREQGRGITENPRFPRGAMLRDNMSGAGELSRHWKGFWRKGQKRWQEAGVARSIQGWQGGFSCYRDREQWKNVFSKQLPWNEFAGRVLNAKWSNMLWMGSFHQNVTQQKAGKNPSLWQALVPDQLCQPCQELQGISMSCDIWAAS